MDFAGNLNWTMAVDDQWHYYSIYDTLQYSKTKSTLYHLMKTTVQTIVRVNSSTGDLIGTHQIDGASTFAWNRGQCKLSNDELAYF